MGKAVRKATPAVAKPAPAVSTEVTGDCDRTCGGSSIRPVCWQRRCTLPCGRHSPRLAMARQPLRACCAHVLPQVAASIDKLRSEAQALFLKKEFGKAADVYDAAFKSLPDGAPERIELWQKRIGCLLNGKRWVSYAWAHRSIHADPWTVPAASEADAG